MLSLDLRAQTGKDSLPNIIWFVTQDDFLCHLWWIEEPNTRYIISLILFLIDTLRDLLIEIKTQVLKYIYVVQITRE
jgi:hypothetical protein